MIDNMKMTIATSVMMIMLMSGNLNLDQTDEVNITTTKKIEGCLKFSVSTKKKTSIMKQTQIESSKKLDRFPHTANDKTLKLKLLPFAKCYT